MKKILFIVLISHLLTCNENTTIPGNYKQIGVVKFVDVDSKFILVNNTSKNELKNNDEISIFTNSKEIAFKIVSIDKWIRCDLINLNYDLSAISEGMKVYTNLRNYTYQYLIDSLYGNKDYINRLIKLNKKYFENMNSVILNNWYPPLVEQNTNDSIKIQKYPNERIESAIILNRKGQVIDARIIKSNGIKSIDESCIEAIKSSKNFGMIPNEFEGELIAVPFYFYYNTK